MAPRWRWILALATMLLLAVGASAEPAETRAFKAAANSFSTGFYQRAESEFEQFGLEYTNSPRLPEAALFQAAARLKLTNYAGAINLLTNRLPAAGAWADQYQFLLGESLLAKGDYRSASDAFALLVKNYPTSTNGLAAVVEQAAALSKLSDWPAVIKLLTNGLFQAAAATNAASPQVPTGYLLLAEAELARGEYTAAEQALQPLAKALLESSVGWHWQYLLCRIRVGQGNPELALQNTSNLLMKASSAGQPDLLAESYAFRAGILESLGRRLEAIASYTNNLVDGLPPGRQRQALLKITELYLKENLLGEAALTLESFLNRFPEAPDADLAWLNLGEFRLRICQADTNNAVTNCLRQAHAAFEALTRKFPDSPLAGKGQLELGWCLWLEGKLPESLPAFQAAIQRLKPSLDQARAYFKLGDVRFQLGESASVASNHDAAVPNYQAAISNYNAVIDQFGDLPDVVTNLFEPALYQAVRAAVALRDVSAATNALSRILTWYPNGYHTERAVLLTGQEISREGDPAQARALYQGFLKLAPGASLAAEVQLAVAHSFEVQTNWTAALEQYDDLLARVTNGPARPRAEYYRASALAQSGNETNALSGFLHFVQSYPGSEYWPLAQWRVGSYYLNAFNYLEAERAFRLLYQNTNGPASALNYQACMMAGRAAFERQNYLAAIDYFTNLTADVKCPLDLQLEARFAYGEMLRSLPPDTNRLANLETAISVFSSICDYRTNRLAPLAWGVKASCLLEWVAVSDRFEKAANAFQQVINAADADARARSIATVGLGAVLEKQAEGAPAAQQAELLTSALNRYLDVLYEKNLRGDETPDVFWRQRAGKDAGRLAESLGQWSQAANIYRQLQQLLPAFSDSLEIKIRNAQKRAGPN